MFYTWTRRAREPYGLLPDAADVTTEYDDRTKRRETFERVRGRWKRITNAYSYAVGYGVLNGRRL